MKISYFYPRWGSNDISWDNFLRDVKHSGYDGVEIGIPEDEKTKKTVLSKIAEYDLKFIAQHYETEESNFLNHKKIFQRRLEKLCKTKPFLINSHSGKDYFTMPQNLELLKIADQISAENNIPIAHETHRSRFCFAAHITADYLKILPNLPITLDISHWMCVAESLLYDQQHAIEICVPHVKLIHSRIGHPQGPQVSDPRLLKWKQTKERHFEIWDGIVNHHRNAGTKELSFTTEFGPPPYMSVLPARKKAVEFQFELNLYMLNQLKKRYK